MQEFIIRFNTNIVQKNVYLILCVSVLSIEPVEAITFNKDGNDITGTITLKNITTDKSLSYKVCIFYVHCFFTIKLY